MFKVNLYTFSKRDNSTKRPSGDGTSYDCIIKTGSGILEPSISLDIGLTSAPTNYNYAYIPAFGRYYFIEEWYFEDRLWTAHMIVDVLATYKTKIGDSNLYVMRASAESDGRITDLLYPAKTGCTFSRVTEANPWTNTVFVVGIVSRVGDFGSLTYYAIARTQLMVLCRNMCDAERIISRDYLFDPNEFSQGLQLSLADPLQYVKTCMMLPVSTGEMNNLGELEENIPVFNYNSGARGTVINPRTRINKSFSFNVPKHPDTNSRGYYVNSAPFTALKLTIPPYGCIDIDTTVTCPTSDDTVVLDVNVELDPISGKGILVVKCKNTVLNRLESQIGVPISLSSVTRDFIGGITNTIGAVGSIAGGVAGAVGNTAVGNAVGAAGSVAHGASYALSSVGDAAKALMPRAQTVGSTGSFVANRGEFSSIL